MSMMPAEVYIEELQDKTYKELIEIRDNLLIEIKDFEEHIDEIMAQEPYIFPSPDTIYQYNLEFLALLFNLLKEKFNNEY